MNFNDKCNCCEKEYPWYLLSSVQIWSREFIGKVIVCDFCYKTEMGEELREYKGFEGWLRKKLRKLWERQHPDRKGIQNE